MTAASVLLVALSPPAAAHHYGVVDKLARGRTELVSLSSNGEQGDGNSGMGCWSGVTSASDDGRFIAFASRAGNLQPADVNGEDMPDVFVYDRKKRRLDLVSAMPSGLAPERPAWALEPCRTTPLLTEGYGSEHPVISGNGRFVAFLSNLPLTGIDDPALQVNYLRGFYNVFVRDLKKHTTELVSLRSNGTPVLEPNKSWLMPDISDSGRFVLFGTGDLLMTEEPCPGTVLPVGCGSQAYVRDRKKDQTLLVSRSNSGERTDAAGGGVGPAFISGNGRYVAFSAFASNLVDQTKHPCTGVYLSPPCGLNIFRHDLRERSTKLVSVAYDGTPSGSASLGHRSNWRSKPQLLSDNGRYVLFKAGADREVPGNPPSASGYVSEYYVRDLAKGRTERVSVSSTGTPLKTSGSGTVYEYSISDDGRYVAERMDSRTPREYLTPFVPGEHYRGPDFVFDRNTGQTDWVMGAAPPEARAGDFSEIGGNGRFVLFEANDDFEDGQPPRVKGDTNGFFDVFVRDIERRPLSTGGFGNTPGEGARSNGSEPPICVEGRCIPPQGAISSPALNEDLADDLTFLGANLYGASLAYRPALKDLFAAIELEHMPPVLPGASPIFYGLRFEVDDRAFEVRATPLLGGTFGLFDCSGSPTCTKVTDLQGGYGTTGMRVVFSLPLDKIGLQEGGELSDVEAFSGFGTYLTGATQILDTVRVR